jgi:plasmid stability protein
MTTTITIHNLDAAIKTRLHVQAARHECSIEDEARNILCAYLNAEPEEDASLVEAIRARVASFGGVELELPAREAIRDPLVLESA